jgi:hypothetical protein
MKRFADFPSNGRNKRGDRKTTHASAFKSVCKPCYVIQMREYYGREPAIYKRLKERERERRTERPAHMMWLASRSRAKAKGIPFSITPSDLEPMPEVCPVLGIPLEYGARGINNPNAASVDRADNSKGYVPGNVVVVSFRANGLKKDATLLELEAILTFYRKFGA